MLLRRAGLEARNLILATDANNTLAQKLLVGTVARMAAENNVQLVEKLAPISEFVRNHVHVVGGRVLLRDAVGFALVHDSVLLRAASSELQEVNSANARSGARSRSTAPLEKSNQEVVTIQQHNHHGRRRRSG